mmetsp:Transcript_10477/g.20354  ORF Transcript_10477/g.20354 Transcript_10477/m.20354 type:complete len:105 (-) Transcript_10477:19-333(-)
MARTTTRLICYSSPVAPHHRNPTPTGSSPVQNTNSGQGQCWRIKDIRPNPHQGPSDVTVFASEMKLLHMTNSPSLGFCNLSLDLRVASSVRHVKTGSSLVVGFE